MLARTFRKTSWEQPCTTFGLEGGYGGVIDPQMQKNGNYGLFSNFPLIYFEISRKNRMSLPSNTKAQFHNTVRRDSGS